MLLFKRMSLEKTALGRESITHFNFLMAPNGDLWAIKKNNVGSATTEIHILSAVSNYQEFILHTSTALHPTGDNFVFLLAPNNDLVVIKKSDTGTNSTEVHINHFLCRKELLFMKQGIISHSC